MSFFSIPYWFSSINNPIKKKTGTSPRAVIYFRAWPRDNNNQNVLITQICSNDKVELQSVVNLYVCRGLINYKSQVPTLTLSASYSGPHHYLGSVNIQDYIMVDIPFNGLPIYNSMNHILDYPEINSINLQKTKPDVKVTINDYKWIIGREINYNYRKRYSIQDIIVNDYQIDYFSSSTTPQLAPGDKIQHWPGILELAVNRIELSVIIPSLDNQIDLSEFRAQMMPNNIPWKFNHKLIGKNPSNGYLNLSLGTYYYGPDYNEKYLLHKNLGNGQYLERHEYCKIITPANPNSNGFIVIGRELETWTGRKYGLQLIAVKIPFGFTLLLEPWAIYSSCQLIGLYCVGMPTDGHILHSADVAFIKNHNNGFNVQIIGKYDDLQKNSSSSLSGDDFLLTSDCKTTEMIKKNASDLIEKINANSGWLSNNFLFGNIGPKYNSKFSNYLYQNLN